MKMRQRRSDWYNRFKVEKDSFDQGFLVWIYNSKGFGHAVKGKLPS